MSLPLVVCNSSPLIALDQIGRLDLLEQLIGRILVPPAVEMETSPMLELPSWVTVQTPTQPLSARVLSASLGSGESGAISLALEISADRLIIDDRPARRLAQGLGLSVIGTLGILLAARRHGYLELVKPALDELQRHHFRMTPELQRKVLHDAGEAGS